MGKWETFAGDWVWICVRHNCTVLQYYVCLLMKKILVHKIMENRFFGGIFGEEFFCNRYFAIARQIFCNDFTTSWNQVWGSIYNFMAGQSLQCTVTFFVLLIFWTNQPITIQRTSQYCQAVLFLVEIFADGYKDFRFAMQ